MILAAVDDLLFSSKIRTTAKQAGVELVFARTPDEILLQTRLLKPALIIFDLNSAKADPIKTVMALRGDPDLKSVRTLGFVSHVDTEVIAAARQAGVDEVMARSAFAANLASIPHYRTVITEIHAAAARIRNRVLYTPLRYSEWLSEVANAQIFLKLETLQPTFSYKIRGATNAVLKLLESGNPLPIVTASAGNHGRAMAHAAAAAGLNLTVYIAEHAPRTKIEAIRRTGAELRPCRDYDEAEGKAKAHGARGNAVFISPYAHPDVIAGAGTVGLEILQENPSIEVIVASVGGGGLVSGIAAAAPGTSVCGVEISASTPFTQSLAAGRIVPVEVRDTIADGLTGNLDPDTMTFAMVRHRVERIVVVEEDEVITAIRNACVEERLIVEGAAAVAMAAVQSRRLDLRGRRAAVVVSGANIDLEKLKAII